MTSACEPGCWRESPDKAAATERRRRSARRRRSSAHYGDGEVGFDLDALAHRQTRRDRRHREVHLVVASPHIGGEKRRGGHSVARYGGRGRRVDTSPITSQLPSLTGSKPRHGGRGAGIQTVDPGNGVIIKQLSILGCVMRALDSAGRTQTYRSCTESSPQQARIPQHLPSKSHLVQERVSPSTREEHDTLKV